MEHTADGHCRTCCAKLNKLHLELQLVKLHLSLIQKQVQEAVESVEQVETALSDLTHSNDDPGSTEQ
jgi:hypothetical protein